MLTYMAAPESVAYYSNASKIIKTIAGTITAIGASLFPRLSLYFYEGRKLEFEQAVSNTVKVILVLAIPSSIGLFLVSNKVVYLMFGESFIPVVKTMCILSPLIILMPLSAGVGSQILQTSNNEKFSLISVFWGAISNLILNFILIPIFLENGAAAASVITEAFVTGLMLLFSYKVIKINIEKRFILSIIFATASLIILVITCGFLCGNLPIAVSLFLQVTIGSVFYFRILIICKNDVILNMLEMIKRKK